MINIAILGGGVVGSGVAEVIDKNASSISQRAGKAICVKKILDIRVPDDTPYRELFTSDPEDVFGDPDISIIVETIGGAKIAFEYTKRALSSGRHVVTSNKELVAKHGPELLQLAADNNVNYLFEASVGGGIPIIRPLNQCLAANEIHCIMGILNGTTNYIITQMKREGKSFETALKEAQQNGYAESNPQADIEGLDACRKIAILSSIAYGEYVDSDGIYTEGISSLTVEDMYYTEAMNCAVKLVAVSRRENGRIFARVSPLMISKDHPLANVEDVFNAIVVQGNAIGEAMFYGRGAGKLPTASAVVADILDIIKSAGVQKQKVWKIPEDNNLLDFAKSVCSWFIRIKTQEIEELKTEIQRLFGDVDFVSANLKDIDDEIAFVSENNTEKTLISAFNNLKSSTGVKSASFIRIEY